MYYLKLIEKFIFEMNAMLTAKAVSNIKVLVKASKINLFLLNYFKV